MARKKIYSVLLICIIFFAVTSHPAFAVLINFDDVYLGPGTATEYYGHYTMPVGDHYLSKGVKFYQGNSSFGQSNQIIGSAWIIRLSDSLQWATPSKPNELIPSVASDNDIIVHFFDNAQQRTTANYVSVRNDLERSPAHIGIAVYDKTGAKLADTPSIGAGAVGQISMPGIWYAVIYKAIGESGALGADDFSFTVDSPLDSDGDGVPDNVDICPGTHPNTPVDPFDSNGCPTVCGYEDERNYIIWQYKYYNVSFIPTCDDFTQTAHTQYFTFNELHHDNPSNFALLRAPLLAPSSSGYGLDKWRENYGAQRTITSAYRTPQHNFSPTVGGAAQSRHMFGDAADLLNESRTEDAVWHNMRMAAWFAGANYVEPSNGPCKYNCVHADWRFHQGGYQP